MIYKTCAEYQYKKKLQSRHITDSTFASTADYTS